MLYFHANLHFKIPKRHKRGESKPIWSAVLKLLVLCPENRSFPPQSSQLWRISSDPRELEENPHLLSMCMCICGVTVRRAVRVNSICYTKLTELSKKGTKIPSHSPPGQPNMVCPFHKDQNCLNITQKKFQTLLQNN